MYEEESRPNSERNQEVLKELLKLKNARKVIINIKSTSRQIQDAIKQDFDIKLLQEAKIDQKKNSI